MTFFPSMRFCKCASSRLVETCEQLALGKLLKHRTFKKTKFHENVEKKSACLAPSLDSSINLNLTRRLLRRSLRLPKRKWAQGQAGL